MTDVATARPASDAPAPKDAPKTFAERGVAVPFTTAELLWARVRQKGNTRELLISGLAQTRGTYVYEWNTIRNRFSLTLHDRLLHKAILTGPTPTPETVRFAALRVAGNGSGGGEAQTLAETANREAENFGIHLRAAVIRRLAEHAQRPDLALTVEELSTPDGLRQAAGTIGLLAPGFRLTEGALQERVDALCSTLAQVGLSGLATEPPPRRVVQRLGLLASALTGWADQGYGDGEGEARLIARTAAETARIAGAALDAIDRDLSNIDGFLAGWSAGRFDTVRGNALRTVWLLDGWERIFRIWQNVSTQDDKARAKALTLMSYVVPLVPTAELEREAAKSWDDINAELTKIIAAHQEGIDLATMLKLLGPDGDKALAGLAMPPPQAKRGAAGLSPEKLTQIVRILEPAMDRADGAPARKMLDELRVHLVRVRPPRAVRAQRALCATFQELLVDGEETSKASARIPRSAITPAWALFRERVNDEEYSSVAPVIGRPENLAKLRQMFVAALKPDLDDAAAFASKARALIVRLGSESHYHALQSMVAAVGVAEPLDRLRKALPKRPIAQFEEPDLDRLADALNDIRRASPQQVQTALFVVMDAMEEPWRISSVLEQLATTGRFRSSAGISGFVATAMIGQIEGQVQDVRKLADALPEGNAAPAKLGESAMALAQSIAHAADSISGTNATLAVAGSHGQIQEVETLRAKLTELVGSKLGSGAAALVSALTGKPATTTNTGAVRPGTRWRFDEPPDGEALRNAELYAMALKRSEGCAAALGMGSQITDSLAQTLEEFEKTVIVLFSQMRSAGLDRVTREYARAHVAGIARVIEILAGADRGERILDKGLEAIG